jgi:hypothetical protein
MIPRPRGGSSPNRGGRGGRVIAQIGNQRLIANNIANNASSSGSTPGKEDPLYKEFLAYKASKSQSGESQPSYANVATQEDSEEGVYEQTPHKEVILLLENKDLRWKDQPWILMQRYLDTASNISGSYKYRKYYEHILIITESCEINHYTAANAAIYNFSKVIIKQIISVDAWGISPFREREFTHPENKIMVKYNYWDYVDAFHKAFLYENQKRKHSWFFRVCPEVYKHDIPNWFYQWWLSYGPSIKIMPEPYKGLYAQWAEISPALIESQHENKFIEGMPSLHYFVQFGIPWIWKWSPEVGYTTQQIPCLRRTFFTKFWKKMIFKDKDGIMESQETLDKIQEAIASYKEQIKLKQQRETPSPFKQIARKIQLIKGQDQISKEEILAHYFEEIKKDLINNLNQEGPSDMSITGSSRDGEDDTELFPGEGQELYDEELNEDTNHQINVMMDNLKESISKIKSKGKSSQ